MDSNSCLTWIVLGALFFDISNDLMLLKAKDFNLDSVPGRLESSTHSHCAKNAEIGTNTLKEMLDITF